MTQPQRPVADESASRLARDGVSTDAGVSALAELEALDARLHALPTTALLAELQGIVAAIETSDPARRRRRAGFLGRLIGRDLVAQAQPDPAETRVRLHLVSAGNLADALSAQSAELTALAMRVRELAQRLRESSAPASPQAGDEDARVRRRLHLEAIATTWENAAAHAEQAHSHARHLLERHAQVRDLLVPAWRQQASLTASAQRRDDEATTRLQHALHAQLAAMRLSLAGTPPASVPPDTTTAGTDAGRATQEPSP